MSVGSASLIWRKVEMFLVGLSSICVLYVEPTFRGN